MKHTLVRLLSAAMLVTGAHAALAQTTGPIAPSNLGSAPATGTTETFSIGDTFLTSPAAVTATTGLQFNFTDVYLFMYMGPSGAASGSAISFSSATDSAITNLQAAVFNLSTSTFATTGAGSYASSLGDTSGALSAWTALSFGANGSATYFSTSNPLTNGTVYAVEVRGLTGTAGGSYGGNLVVSSVPEPATLSTAFLGLIGAFAVARRTRRRRGAA